MKTVWILLVTCGLLGNAWAEEVEKPEEMARNPLGCRNVGYQYQLNTVQILPHQEGEPQSLYFFYNSTLQPLKLYQMSGDRAMFTTSLSHTIPPRQWAALATGVKDLKFLCAVNPSDNHLGKIVSCRETLKVCEFSKTRFGLNNKGNYWVSPGNTRGGAVAEVVYYGIIPQ